MKLPTLHILLLVAMCVSFVRAIYDIRQFGAIPNQDHVSAQFANQQAFIKAVLTANSTSTGERVVRVPKGSYYFMPMTMNNIHNVSILIEGRMAASKSILKWPKQPDGKYFQDFISCHQCSYLTISGGGRIDGRGYHWWLVCILDDKKYLENQNYRPHLIHLTQNTHTVIHDIILKNSAQFHLKMDNCYDAELYNINVKVNVTAQINLFKKFSLEGLIPLFPLNTDGIDPSGARMHIYNLTVLNYDDVVVPKPSNAHSHGGNCTQDMLVENCTVILGVGMSVGSVPPNSGCNCIRNITFRNVEFIKPLKAIYVKTNPGDEGTGLVENILYYNITMDRPLWWAIYIGPQQMKEPDGDGPGCMLYPFDKHGTCTTQPRVTLRNITLRDISIHNSLLYPVTIRCNVSNPCEDINFYNVRTDSWQIGQKKKGYVCEYSTGKGSGNQPLIDCIKEDKSDIKASGDQEEYQPSSSSLRHDNHFWKQEGHSLGPAEFKLMLQEM